MNFLYYDSIKLNNLVVAAIEDINKFQNSNFNGYDPETYASICESYDNNLKFLYEVCSHQLPKHYLENEIYTEIRNVIDKILSETENNLLKIIEVCNNPEHTNIAKDIVNRINKLNK